jgi:dUTPase
MKFELIHPDAKLPTMFGSGLDLYAIDDFEIPACELRVLDLGIVGDIPHDCIGMIKDRDSLAARGIVVAGGVYHPGESREWKVTLRNTRIGGAFRGVRGDKIAQVAVLLCYATHPEQVTFFHPPKRSKRTKR